ncbi:MAG TPA: WecB/TagA/CpsF family glycosyltransferase [Abditibacterium sp.]|jgi:N-acetylglucosaminyldiphosphoundecaprenol N-acetyl-beta-D-mannosaminyltransferase
MFFLLFIAAAVLMVFGLALSKRTGFAGGPRPEGLFFVLAVTLVGFGGFAYLTLSNHAAGINQIYSSLESIKARPLVPDEFWQGLQLWVLVLGVYGLSALRGVAGWPAWVADAVVVGAAYLALRFHPTVAIEVASPSDGALWNLGALAKPLTIAWIWLASRLCATLNRVPSVASGYLGLVAGLMFILMGGSGAAHGFFAPTACIALVGAGLTTFFLSVSAPQRNLGWSATLAMGWLLGVASAIGVFKDTLPAMIALAVLALGLPLLDVTLLRVRARLRGQRVEWKQSRQRLHETLAARGVPPRKIALLFFFLGLWCCTLALWLSLWMRWGVPNFWLSLLLAVLTVMFFIVGAVAFYSIARLLMRRLPGEEVPDSIEAFGVKISPVSMQEALDQIENFIASGTPHHVLTSDANAILTSRNDPEYAAIMRRAALITPDGFGVIWGARLLNLPIYERVTGVDMVTGVCERAAKKGYRIYILGAAEGIAATAARNLCSRYPGLQVVGTHHGFWRRDGKEQGLSIEESDLQMAQQIAAHRADVLFVAMGIPHQEKFIAAQLDRLNVPVALGVGGSFDVYAGKFNRAPQTVQRLGLEWLYRVWIDPSRWKRMGYVPKFMIVALKTWLSGAKTAPEDGVSARDAF